MSRTDNTDPYWVHRMRYGVISHDHRHGACVVETDARPRRSTYNHYRRCPRWTRVETPCAQVDYCYRRSVANTQARIDGTALTSSCGRVHETWVHDHPDRACDVCDAVMPTCEREIAWHERYGRYWGNAPRWWRHHVTHGRNRTTGRMRLGELRKEWNSRGDDFDEDDWDVPAYTRSNANEYWD